MPLLAFAIGFICAWAIGDLKSVLGLIVSRTLVCIAGLKAMGKNRDICAPGYILFSRFRLHLLVLFVILLSGVV